MKHLSFPLFLAVMLLFVGSVAYANDKNSDAVIKSKLLGYWQSPRHAYLIKDDGVIYMCPQDICTTTNRWDVKNGLFYWDSEPNDILTLTSKEFSFRRAGSKDKPYKMTKITKAEAE